MPACIHGRGPWLASSPGLPGLFSWCDGDLWSDRPTISMFRHPAWTRRPARSTPEHSGRVPDQTASDRPHSAAAVRRSAAGCSGCRSWVVPRRNACTRSPASGVHAGGSDNVSARNRTKRWSHCVEWPSQGVRQGTAGLRRLFGGTRGVSQRSPRLHLSLLRACKLCVGSRLRALERQLYSEVRGDVVASSTGTESRARNAHQRTSRVHRKALRAVVASHDQRLEIAISCVGFLVDPFDHYDRDARICPASRANRRPIVSSGARVSAPRVFVTSASIVGDFWGWNCHAVRRRRRIATCRLKTTPLGSARENPCP